MRTKIFRYKVMYKMISSVGMQSIIDHLLHIQTKTNTQSKHRSTLLKTAHVILLDVKCIYSLLEIPTPFIKQSEFTYRNPGRVVKASRFETTRLSPLGFESHER